MPLGKFPQKQHLLCMSMKPGNHAVSHCPKHRWLFSTVHRSATPEELLSKEEMVTVHPVQVTVQKEHHTVLHFLLSNFLSTHTVKILFSSCIFGLHVGFIVFKPAYL